MSGKSDDAKKAATKKKKKVTVADDPDRRDAQERDATDVVQIQLDDEITQIEFSLPAEFARTLSREFVRDAWFTPEWYDDGDGGVGILFVLDGPPPDPALVAELRGLAQA